MNTIDSKQDQTNTILLILGMLAFLAVLYLPTLSSLPLLHEEPRRALIARTMMQSGEYFVPMLMEQIYTSKPPLYNWLIALFSAIPGDVSEFTARLPSLVFLFLTAVVMVVGLRNYLQFRSRAFLGFAILLTPELIAKANLAEIDIVFTFLVTFSVWIWFWLFDRGERGLRLWLLPLFIVALSYLTKREPSIVFFYLGIAPFLIVKKQFKELFSPGHIVSVIAMLAIIGGWLWIMIGKTGLDALLENLQAQVINRGISSNIIDYVEHISSYPVKLFVAMFPFAMLLLVLFFKDVRKALRNRYQDLFLFSLVVVLANLPLYWLRGDAAVRYFLPMFPTALVLAAMVFDAYTAKDRCLIQNRIINVSVRICGVLLVVLALAFLGSSFLSFFDSAPPTIVPWYVVLIVAIPMLVVSVRQAKASFVAPAMAILPVFLGVMIVVKLLFISTYLPYKLARINEDRNGALVLAEVRTRMPQKQPVQVVGHVHFSLFFYAQPDELMVPKHFTAQHTGYAIGYESTPEMKSLIASQGWRTLYETAYRDEKLVFGIKDK